MREWVPDDDRSVMGKKVTFTREEAHDWMWDRRPGFHWGKIPREVMERLDLTPLDKLIYSFFCSYGSIGTIARKSEVAGICCTTPKMVEVCITNLAKAGLLKINKRFYPDSKRQMASTYIAIVPPQRFTGKPTHPRFVENDISDIERQIRETFKFDDIELECEASRVQK